MIADRLERHGYPVTGDVSPEMTLILDRQFSEYVRMISLNNSYIANMNDEEDQDDRSDD